MFYITIVRPCPRHVLGLSSDAHHSQQEIKVAFRKLVKQHHPDVGGNNDRFKEICNAYDSLSGKSSRDTVDCSASGFYDHPHGARGDRSGSDWYAASRSSAPREQDHGMHAGGTWANQNGASANYSTRDFYRPYEPFTGGVYRKAHGFTDEEMNEARRNTLIHYIWNACKFTLVTCSLVYMYVVYSKEDRIQKALRAQSDGYSAEYIDKYITENGDGKQKQQKSYYERKMDEIETEVTNRQLRENGVGGKSSNADQYPCNKMILGVSYKGRPFTPEGVAETRVKNRYNHSDIDLETIDEDTSDLSFEMDESII